MAKITGALPPSGLDFARQMSEFFSIGLGPHKAYARHRETLERLNRAVAERRTVQMRYHSASLGRVTRREVDPYHLGFAAGGLYLIAYCHVRRDVRMFAVERIRSLTVTAHAFQGLRMTLQVADTRELIGWILSFGRGARVVKPAALRERVRQEALALARH